MTCIPFGQLWQAADTHIPSFLFLFSFRSDISQSIQMFGTFPAPLSLDALGYYLSVESV